MNKNKLAKRIAREFRKFRRRNPLICNYLINIKSNTWLSVREKNNIIQHWRHYKNKDYYGMLSYLTDEYGRELCENMRTRPTFIGGKTYKLGDNFYSENPDENDSLPF